MARKKYAYPPVWEVSFEARWAEPFENALSGLAPLRDALAPHFEEAKTENEIQFNFSMSPDKGAGRRGMEQRPLGYLLLSNDPGWTCRIRSESLSLHLTRREPWPRSRAYPGWESFEGKLAEVLELARSSCEAHAVSRAGLRYQNKIAAPHPGGNPEFGKWFPKGVEPSLPEFGECVRFASVRALEPLRCNPNLGASLRLATIDIDDPEVVRTGRIGIGIDIDVYTLPESDLPGFRDLRSWAVTAHDAENALFEACITDELRTSFAEDPGSRWR